MNGTLLTRDGRSVLRFERTLSHPPEKVWRAITEPEALAGWFPGRIEGERKAGAPLRFVQADQETHGEFLDFEPPRLLSYTWADSVLRFELRPDPARCLLILTHTFDDRPAAASYATGWQACLDGLDGVLIDKSAPVPPPDQDAATDAYRVRHEAYAQIFDLLTGVVDGDTVRFERLLPYPADQVWSTIGG